MTARPKPKIPFYWWPLWMLLLACALFVFYVVFTPAWVAIRLVAWLSERRHRASRRRRGRRAAPPPR